jgi:glycosyltransferase involved in cell wall biosynthesis
LEQAKQVDLLLVDHSPLAGWPGPYKVRRANYCTDDHLFVPEEKVVDVAMHWSVKGCVARGEIEHLLPGICERDGWSLSYRGLPPREYARALARARVVVNFPKTPTNRPNRVMDAMAARTCLLTGALPIVDGTGMVPGEHYVTFNRPEDLAAGLHQVLDAGEWERVADAGYELVMAKHTWAVRAAEFRQMLAEEFGL